MSEDYYSVLGLERNATDDDIRKAYRKLAVIYHPDKQVGKPESEVKQAEEKFKKISEAYQILSDPDEKAKYDQFGKNTNRGFDNQAAFNIFNQFFGGGVPGNGSFSFSFGGPGFKTSTQSVSSNDFDDFEDISSFGQSPIGQSPIGQSPIGQSPFDGISFERIKGMMQNNQRSSRQKKQKMQNVSSTRNLKSPDQEVEYEVSLKDFYTGTRKQLRINQTIGSIRTTDTIEIEIKQGFRDGVKVTYPGKADCPAEFSEPGDLIIILKEKKNSLAEFGFARRSKFYPHSEQDDVNHSDLVCVVELTLKEAQKGCSKTIEHMDGHQIQITVPKLSNSNQEIVLPNEGVSIRKKGSIVGNGDLYVRFNIVL